MRRASWTHWNVDYICYIHGHIFRVRFDPDIPWLSEKLYAKEFFCDDWQIVDDYKISEDKEV